MTSKNLVSLRMCGKTDVGCVRSNNEDNFIVADLVNAHTLVSSDILTRTVAENRALIAVADGMGGAAAGEVASAYAIEGLKAEFCQLPAAGTPERLIRAIEGINRQILAAGASNPKHKGMATTITAALIEGKRAYIAEVGDSRAYIIRGGRIKQITTDQNWLELMIEQGLLSREEAKTAKRRNVILQSLGGQPQVKVALTAVELAAGDSLLLCSDGLSEKLSALEMMKLVDSSPTLVDACDHMIELAKLRGGEDNITVVVASFEGEGLTASAAPEGLISHIEVISVFDHVADIGMRDTRKFSSEQRGRTDFKTTIRVKTSADPELSYPEAEQLREQASALAEYSETLQLALEQQLFDLDQYSEWQLRNGHLDLLLQQSLEMLKSAVPSLTTLQSTLAECNKQLYRCTEKRS